MGLGAGFGAGLGAGFGAGLGAGFGAGLGAGLAASALRARHTGEVTMPVGLSFLLCW